MLKIDLRRPRRYCFPILGIILVLRWAGGSAFATAQSPANDTENAPAAVSAAEEDTSAPAHSHATLPDAPEPALHPS